MTKTLMLKDRVVKRMTMGVKSLMKSHSVEVFQAMGRITPELDVELDNGELLHADKIIAATGSKPGRLDVRRGAISRRV